MLLGSLLVNWSTWESSISTVDLLRLPDEVLKKIALVLLEEKILGLGNYIAEVCDQSLTFGGELLGRGRESFRFEEAIESDVDLLVLSVISTLMPVHLEKLTDGTLPAWKAEGVVSRCQGVECDGPYLKQCHKIGVCD